MSDDAVGNAHAFNPDWRAGLTCHIEMEVLREAEAAAARETARVLRELADKIEADLLDTGFHKVIAPDGSEYGQIYLDHFAQMS